jgi:hypothetical protein
MFQKLQYILLFVVFVVFIFFVVSTFTFSGRLAEGTGSVIRGSRFSTYSYLCRLCGKELEGPLVASRRLAILALLLRLRGHRLLVAPISQQQQISPPHLCQILWS